MASDCCFSCHFELEESEILPYLPTPLADQIRIEHILLRQGGFQDEAMRVHSEKEEGWYREFGVPRGLMKRIEEDHYKQHLGIVEKH